MSMFMRRGLGLSAVLALVVAAGCNQGGEHDVVKTTGTVTLNGQPVPDLVVVFTPESQPNQASPGKSATGNTDAQGKFTLSTYEVGDGAVVGKHQVMVSLDAPDPRPPGKLPPESAVLEVTPGQENHFDIALVP